MHSIIEKDSPIRITLLLVVVFVLLSACGPARWYVTPLGPQVQRAAVPVDSVVVYRTTEQVPGKYTEIAIVSGDAYFGDISVNDLRKKAASLGANGLLLIPVNASQASISNASGQVVGRVTTDESRKAVAIYVHAQP